MYTQMMDLTSLHPLSEGQDLAHYHQSGLEVNFKKNWVLTSIGLKAEALKI